MERSNRCLIQVAGIVVSLQKRQHDFWGIDWNNNHVENGSIWQCLISSWFKMEGTIQSVLQVFYLDFLSGWGNFSIIVDFFPNCSYWISTGI